MLSRLVYLAALVLPALVAAQSADLAGQVGPLTSLASKRAKKICDVTTYGAKADGATDISTALNSAFNDCKSGGVIVVPSGNYALSNFVTFSGGNGWALQLDGIISRAGSGSGGNMFLFTHGTDVEFFSSTSKGAIQGNGYTFHAQGIRTGPRILRVVQMSHFSVHDITLVDSPAFHFSIDTCTNGEVYNIAIRGANWGGLDGIDVWGSQLWLHDIMVTNKDECITIKNPSHNILVENVYCNWSGGCAMGSLAGGTDISNITYKNVYTWSSNQMYMIKTHGGSGSVSNVVLENFIGHGNAYSLDIDQYWNSMAIVPGPGVQLNNIQVMNWTGTESNGASRGPVKVICADGAPCTGVDITDFHMWTETGNTQVHHCQSAYTNLHRSPPLFCLNGGQQHIAYPLTSRVVTSPPTGYAAPRMPDDLTTPTWGISTSIPIPTMPASFFPGTPPISAPGGA